MRRNGLLAAVLMLCGAPLPAQEWAREMFHHVEHDFGVVARGAKAEHRFTFKSPWVEDVHVASVTSSCGCTVPTVIKSTIHTAETSEIVATLDTRNHVGPKQAAITVRFDLPFPAEVILKVSSYIRGDIVVQPGAAQFGSVLQGSAVDRTLTVTYAGRDDWAITGVEVNNSNLKVVAKEVGRKAGTVDYNLQVRLSDKAPPGYLKEQLWLITNDLNDRTRRVPIPVEGLVTAGLSVRPSSLLLGVVTPGQPVTRYVVVQGQEVFRVRRVQCGDPRFKFEFSSDAKNLQLISVTFDAQGRSGSVDDKIHIETDVKGGATLEVAVQGRVTEATATSAELLSPPATATTQSRPQPVPLEKP